MEIETTIRTIAVPETVFDDVTECPVDCNFTLPDYLPEISTVLKCLMKPVVQTHQISGDRVMADGMIYLQFLYLDEDRKCVRSFEYSQPFATAFTVKNFKSFEDITLNVKPGYLNCRATGPRGVEVHGAFSVRLTLVSQMPVEVVESTENKNVFYKSETVHNTVLDASVQKQFTINEVLETGRNLSAEQLLRNESVAVITECKQLPEKAIVKGDILLRTYYIADTQTGTIGCTKSRIPFSQILDVEGLTEEKLCHCEADVLLCDVHVTQNANDDNSLLSVTLKVLLALRTYSEECCTVMTDVFHTEYPLKVQTQRLMASQIISLHHETQNIRQSMELPDSTITEIVDTWCDIVSVDTACEETSAAAKARLNICMITRDVNGNLAYYERTADTDITFDDHCDQLFVQLMLVDCEYHLNGGYLELQLQFAVTRKCLHSHTCLAVTSLAIEENAPYSQEAGMNGCSLKAYFAKTGDSVWDIAKREHTSPWQLQEENELTEDILKENKVLLIPIV